MERAEAIHKNFHTLGNPRPESLKEEEKTLSIGGMWGSTIKIRVRAAAEHFLLLLLHSQVETELPLAEEGGRRQEGGSNSWP